MCKTSLMRNYLMNKKMYDFMVLLQTLVDWVTIISGFATTFLVIVVIFQTSHTRKMVILTREEMENSLRPWVGRLSLESEGIHRDLDGNPAFSFRFNFRNYGGIPAINSLVNVMYGKVLLKLEDLNENDAVPFGSIMPNEERYYRFFIPAPLIGNIKDKGDKLYILVSLNYEYAKNKKGAYSIRAKYDDSFNAFVLQHENSHPKLTPFSH